MLPPARPGGAGSPRGALRADLGNRLQVVQEPVDRVDRVLTQLADLQQRGLDQRT
jgi:hypothetical protein